MATVDPDARILLLLLDFDEGLIARAATPWERLLARICVARLDRELAGGASPDTSAALALRARALLRPHVQCGLAAQVTRVLAEGMGPVQRVRGSRVPVRRDNIQAAADMLRELIDRLSCPGLLPVKGIAMVRILLADGAGPIYHRGPAEELLSALEQALAALGPGTGYQGFTELGPS
jgi:hypothetical protein